MSIFKTSAIAAACAAVALAGVPVTTFAQTGSGIGSVVNCDASGSRQAKGAIIGGIAGAVIGNNVSDSKSAPLVGGLAGAAAGSYIGCQQQREKAAAKGLGVYVATTNVNIRSAAGTSARKVGTLRAGEQVRVTAWSGSWARIKISSDVSGFVSGSYLRYVSA